MTLPSAVQNGNTLDLKISLPDRTDDRRLRHIQPSVNGLGTAALPGPIVRTHWPPPNGADTWRSLGEVVDEVLTGIADKMRPEGA